MMTFGTRLKELRIKNDLTQKELAQKIGFNTRMVQFLEAGDRQPNLETLTKLCDLFDCTADYLLGRTDDPKGESDVTSDEILGQVSQIQEMLDYISPHIDKVKRERYQELIDEMINYGNKLKPKDPS